MRDDANFYARLPIFEGFANIMDPARYQPLPDDWPPGRFPARWLDQSVPGPGESAYTVVRGACFLRAGAASMRSAHRRRLSVTRRNRWTGFRPAALLPCRPRV